MLYVNTVSKFLLLKYIVGLPVMFLERPNFYKFSTKSSLTFSNYSIFPLLKGTYMTYNTVQGHTFNHMKWYKSKSISLTELAISIHCQFVEKIHFPCHLRITIFGIYMYNLNIYIIVHTSLISFAMYIWVKDQFTMQGCCSSYVVYSLLTWVDGTELLSNPYLWSSLRLQDFQTASLQDRT